MMGMQLAPSKDLGLRHVLENSLAVLDGRPTPRSQREIIESLREIIAEADRGSDLLTSHSLSLTAGTQPAVDRFSVFSRILKKDSVSAELKEAGITLADLHSNKEVDDRRLAALRELIRTVLEGLSKDRSLTPLAAPKNFSYL